MTQASPIDIPLLVKLYNERHTFKQLEKLLHADYRRLSSILTDAGVSVRSRTSKYFCNEHAFDTLSPEVEYWLGFLLTDGCIYDPGKRTPRIELRLAEIDKEHIEAFKQFLNSSTPLIFHKKQKAWSLIVPSALLVTKLAQYGIVPRKTYIQQHVPSALKLSPHFWRGVIDGDGCIHTTQRHRVTLVSANHLLLEDFVAYVRSVEPNTSRGTPFTGNLTNCHGAAKTVSIPTFTAQRLLNVLYANGISLPRKLLKAREFGGVLCTKV